jgi:hypothetical protein
MEIIQEIGSYAGFAAVVGLAVLSVLYFSQARDVKRLREWAGRAPERGPSPTVAEPRGVVAQPIVRTPARPVPGGTPPPVPRPPGAQPATPAAAAAAAGATPAVAHGPAVDDDEEEEGAEDELDVTAMDTVVHPPPAPLDGDEDEGEIEEGPDDEIDEGFDDDAQADEEIGDAADEQDPGGAPETGDGADGDPGDTGEWRPEDEHSDIDFTDEHDAVPAPATPAGGLPRPPIPPRPYQRRAAAATGQAGDRVPILPSYAEAQARSESPPSVARARRPVLLAVAAMVAIAIGAFAVLQVTGGDDSGGGDDAGLSSGATTGSGASGSGGGSDAPAIVPADVTVAVLNGTTVPGLAATIGDKIVGEGFQRGTVTNNFDQERAESVVLYAPGSEREAADVSRRLGISQREAIDAESQALAGDATVVVVAGADQNQ